MKQQAYINAFGCPTKSTTSLDASNLREFTVDFSETSSTYHPQGIKSWKTEILTVITIITIIISSSSKGKV
jgi:hypothetical protein